MSVYDQFAFTDKWGRHVKRAIAYLKNAEHGLYGVKFKDTPLIKLIPVDYWTLLDQALDTALAITERLPDDYFEDSAMGDPFGLSTALGINPSDRYNTSDGWLEKAQKIVAEIERRRERTVSLRKIAALENVEGRTPEEAESYRRKAAELRERISA